TVGEHHAHPNANAFGSFVPKRARPRARLGLGSPRKAGTTIRDPRRPTGGRKRRGSSIARSGIFCPSECDTPPARIARCGGSNLGEALPRRAAGPTDRPHLAQIDAQGATLGHFRLMHLQIPGIRAPNPPPLHSTLPIPPLHRRPQPPHV